MCISGSKGYEDVVVTKVNEVESNITEEVVLAKINETDFI